MPLDLNALLQKTEALLEGHFRLSSGLHSPNYVQCARLLEQPENARAVGEAIAEKIASWSPTRIVAPAMGGVIVGYTVAQALRIPMVFTERKEGLMTLRRGFSLAPNDRVVIVEDVVTTGKSTLETVAVVDPPEGSDNGSGRVVGFASILNRTGRENPFGRPYAFLLEMDLRTFPEETCPSCKAGVPLDSPGSRFSTR